MSINNSHYGTNGVLLYNGEIILIYYDGVELSLDPNVNVPIMKGHKKGRIYLTSHRVVFVNKNQNDTFQSFSMPFNCMRNLDIEQPVFGANFIKGETRSEPYGRWDGLAKFKIWFNNGGAIEFGQCLMNAGRLASQARAAQQFTYTASANANIYPAPPPAYTNLNPNAYGWVPMNRFPDRPEANTVYMYDQPPPYAGIYESSQNHHSFDEKTKVNSGFVDPTDPNKVYVAATAPPSQDEEPPAYSENMKKKN